MTMEEKPLQFDLFPLAAMVDHLKAQTITGLIALGIGNLQGQL
jgi:hypothetical protein